MRQEAETSGTGQCEVPGSVVVDSSEIRPISSIGSSGTVALP